MNGTLGPPTLSPLPSLSLITCKGEPILALLYFRQEKDDRFALAPTFLLISAESFVVKQSSFKLTITSDPKMSPFD